jgi:hypothetical protein
VGAHTFYLDPTHEKPLPPKLLAFLPEHCGFHRTRILRLQEPDGLADSPCPGLADVLFNASPDYAVVARKSGTLAMPSLTDQTDQAEQPTGQSSPTAAGRFSTTSSTGSPDAATGSGQTVRTLMAEDVNRKRQATASDEHPEDQLDILFQKTQGIDSKTLAYRYDTALTARLDDLERQWAAHHQECKILTDELGLIYSSRSWKITRPLRWASETARNVRSRHEIVWKSLPSTVGFHRLQRIRRPLRPKRTRPEREAVPRPSSSDGKPARPGQNPEENELNTDKLLRRILKKIQAFLRKGDRPE